MSEIKPGEGAGGAPGAAEQYARMGPHEIVYQQLLANPPPLPVKYSPPLTDKEFDEAVQMYLDRLGETATAAWDQVHEQRMGHVTEAQWLALWQSHEPLDIPQWKVMEMQLAEAAATGQLDPLEAETRAQLAQADPAQQNPVPNPWLAKLISLSSRQAKMDMQRYIRIRARDGEQ